MTPEVEYKPQNSKDVGFNASAAQIGIHPRHYFKLQPK